MINVPLSAIPNSRVRGVISKYKGGNDTASETSIMTHDRSDAQIKRKLDTSDSLRSSTPLRTRGLFGVNSPGLNSADWLDY